MTLDEELQKHFPDRDLRIDNFIKSYLKEFVKNVKSEKRTDTDPLHSYMPSVYNQALSDQEAKIAEELERRGI